jgi:hypothetical protein
MKCVGVYPTPPQAMGRILDEQKWFRASALSSSDGFLLFVRHINIFDHGTAMRISGTIWSHGSMF